MTVRMVRLVPMYMAEWENGTRVFFPTREIHPYHPHRISADRARIYAEELAAAADLLDEWTQRAAEENVVVHNRRMKYVPRLYRNTLKENLDVSQRKA